MILGCDAAGLDEDGNEVLVHAVISDPAWRGDETEDPRRSLLSERHQGTFADRVAVPRANSCPKPASLSFAEAACLPTAWLTAYRMLFVQGGLEPGQSVLVQGAGGGVATALITLARAGGLQVLATSRDEAKRARALEIGAHAVVRVRCPAARRVDAVMETVGAATWTHSLRSLRPGGTLVISGATSGPNPDSTELNRIFFLQLRVIGSTMGTSGELARLVLVPRRHRHAALDRPDPADDRGPRRASPRWPAATSSARSSSPADGHASDHRCRLRHRYGGRRRPARARRRAACSLARDADRAATLARGSRAPRRWWPTWPTPRRWSRLAVCRSGSTPCCTSPGSSSWLRSPSFHPHLREQLDVNLVSPALLTRACLPALRAAGGIVVFVNSAAGLSAGATWAAYAASKFGLRALADSLRAEEMGNGVRVTTCSRRAPPRRCRRRCTSRRAALTTRRCGSAPRPSPPRSLHVLDVPRDATIPEVTVRPLVPWTPALSGTPFQPIGERRAAWLWRMSAPTPACSSMPLCAGLGRRRPTGQLAGSGPSVHEDGVDDVGRPGRGGTVNLGGADVTTSGGNAATAASSVQERPRQDRTRRSAGLRDQSEPRADQARRGSPGEAGRELGTSSSVPGGYERNFAGDADPSWRAGTTRRPDHGRGLADATGPKAVRGTPR